MKDFEGSMVMQVQVSDGRAWVFYGPREIGGPCYVAAKCLPYRGERDCSDCMTMTHCETHHKEDGLYP